MGAQGISLDDLAGRQWPPPRAPRPPSPARCRSSRPTATSPTRAEVAVNVVAGMRSTYPQEPGSDGLAAEEAV